MATNPLAAINSVALAIGRFPSLREMLDYALGKVLEVVETEAGSVYLLDEERAELSLVVHRGLSRAAWNDFDHLKLGEGLSGRVALDGKPIVVRNLKDDPRLTRMAARWEDLRGFASVPLKSNFKIYGTLNVHTRAEREFSEADVQLLTSMASQIGLAVANARLYLDLQASERKFRGLVENAEDLIYLTDREGRLVYANPALERLLGHSPRVLDGDGLTLLTLVHPADRERVAPALARMLAGDVVRALEFRLMHADGERFRWFSQTNVPLRDETGETTGMQCIAHDMTERREMQEQMAQAARLADLGRMAANIAHEIRNPLGAIVNSINVLRRPGAAGDPRLLAIVTEEADRLDGIIREFLLFARPPARAAVSCDVGELLDTTVMLFRRDAKVPAEVGVGVRLEPDLPAIVADPNQMRQVLWNLLANAVEGLGDGPAPARVDIEASAGALRQTVDISVTDDGPGVTDPVAVFAPFFTTKAQGTGLGLAVVDRIVRDHGGTISVENVPHRGARFTVSLPVASGPVPAEAPAIGMG
jgi:two-component system, sporulation sensor kinase E